MEWQDIITGPKNVVVLLYCPDRDTPTNPERIELGYAYRERGDGTISYHSWATHWMPLPEPPEVEDYSGRFIIEAAEKALNGEPGALLTAFIWRLTKEGHDFWENVEKNLRKGIPMPTEARDILTGMIADKKSTESPQ